MKYIAWIICSLSLCFSCKTPANSGNNSTYKENIPDSSKYANVFHPWDGNWQGEFMVLNHKDGQMEGQIKPEIKKLEDLLSLPLDTSLIISVKQTYRSTSPYYQTVNITDTYPSGDSLVSVNSEGYNAVRGDSLICVVHKPDETVLHQGQDLGKGIIIWSREIPGKCEYFFETATDSSYTIVGWGYYGQDDLKKSPKTYFFGSYKKI
ncbi:MAG: hypothetical protein MRZ79_18195 [Bacteroidia bacterium]|nr:hypothetical protein [Bacteroidia bacterium]